AFQVLEHLPWDKVEACLAGMRERAERYVLVSLPCNGLRVRLSFAIGGLRFSRGVSVRLPWKLSHTDEHHWELGPYRSIREVTRLMQRYFEVVDRFYVRENPYHYFWVLRVPER